MNDEEAWKKLFEESPANNQTEETKPAVFTKRILVLMKKLIEQGKVKGVVE